MSRMLNRLKKADKSREESKGADNKYEASLKKKKEETAKIEKDQATAVASSHKETVPPEKPAHEARAGSGDTAEVVSKKNRRSVQEHREQGVVLEEVSALFDEASQAKTPATLGKFVKVLFCVLLVASVGVSVFVGLSKYGVIDAQYYTQSLALVSVAKEKSEGVVQAMQGKKTVRFVIHDFNTADALQNIRSYKSQVSLLQGLKTEVYDYSLNLNFRQFGDRPYPAQVDFSFSDFDVQTLETADISFMLKGSENNEYPLQASVILYGDSAKFAKDLGPVSLEWKRYTIPLSSFTEGTDLNHLQKLRLKITQPRQLNKIYDVFIDDIEVKGVQTQSKKIEGKS